MAGKIRIFFWLMLFAVGIFFLTRVLAPSAPVRVADGSALVLELGGGYVESASASPFARLAGDDTQSFLGLLSMFSLAERDDRIQTVVLHMNSLNIGWGKSEELREALGRLNSKGKRTVAFLEIGTFGANRELFIASAADETYVSPGGAIALTGLSVEYLFLGPLMEKLGVKFDVAKAGRYKSAVEAYSEGTMSEASREMANSLLDDTYRRFVSGLATGRGLTSEEVRAAIDVGTVRSQRLEAMGLIDGEIHFDQLMEQFEETVSHSDYAGVDPADLGFEAKSQIALIYGAGTVVHGAAGGSPLNTEVVFASETTADALIEASEDPDIAAIVLRIDSPGGSALAAELIARAIERARDNGTPVIASFSDVAASAGYYVAAGADSIVSDAGTLTGSIGVLVLRPVLAGLLDKIGIGVDVLTRGRHADFSLSSQKMSPASLARLQTGALDAYQLFLTRVADGRGMTVEEADAIAQGRVWTGAQALEIGLVDEIGGIYTAVRRAKEAAGLQADDDVFLIPFPGERSLGEQIFDAFAQGAVARAGAPIDWPAPLDRLASLARTLPPNTPLMIPPALIEIH